jgi:hypothetical protein
MQVIDFVDNIFNVAYVHQKQPPASARVCVEFMDFSFHKMGWVRKMRRWWGAPLFF